MNSRVPSCDAGGSDNATGGKEGPPVGHLFQKKKLKKFRKIIQKIFTASSAFTMFVVYIASIDHRLIFF
jgi:hypothetical protein